MSTVAKAGALSRAIAHAQVRASVTRDASSASSGASLRRVSATDGAPGRIAAP
jgi:hypothetical protein